MTPSQAAEGVPKPVESLDELEQRLALWCQIREPSPLVRLASVRELLSSSLHYVRELQRRLSAQSTEGWRPIESAPRDGTGILLCWAINADGEPIDWREDPNTAHVFVQTASWSDIERRWVVYISTPSDASLHFEPTHWRPLPAPPTLASRDVP